MTLAELSKRLKPINILEKTKDAIENTNEIALQLNRDQMFSGIRSDGSEITPKYRPLTVFLKAQEGRPTDRVTLNDTGSFYRYFILRIQGDEFYIDSTDDKSTKLKTDYGEKIFGLTKQSQIQWIPALQSHVVRSIASDTGLNVTRS